MTAIQLIELTVFVNHSHIDFRKKTSTLHSFQLDTLLSFKSLIKLFSSHYCLSEAALNQDKSIRVARDH